jgi:spore coat polysaccharide biosynthesis protein SpsF
MKIGFLITARMKSTRLPKKLTLKIKNREVIAWMIDRLKQCNILNEIIIATSTNPEDNTLCEIAKREDVKCYKGSEDDVLERLYQAAKAYHLDYIINITADCPLVGYEFTDEIVKLYKETDADLITAFDLPHGFYSYGIKIDAIKRILKIKNDNDTEVWGRYFTDTGLFKVVDLEVPKELQRKNYRLTLDYQEDFDFLKAVFNGLGDDAYKKSSKEIIEFLDKYPDIVKINEHCEKIGQKRIERQSKLVLK